MVRVRVRVRVLRPVGTEVGGDAEVEQAAHDDVLLLVRLLQVLEVLDPPGQG